MNLAQFAVKVATNDLKPSQKVTTDNGRVKTATLHVYCDASLNV